MPAISRTAIAFFDPSRARVPFQIGLTLLRIARNDWVSAAHRRRLTQEAKIILRTFLMDIRALLFDIQLPLLIAELQRGISRKRLMGACL
jgi:hypothetical protein